MNLLHTSLPSETASLAAAPVVKTRQRSSATLPHFPTVSLTNLTISNRKRDME